jgi:hypothetical protein
MTIAERPAAAGANAAGDVCQGRPHAGNVPTVVIRMTSYAATWRLALWASRLEAMNKWTIDRSKSGVAFR